VRMPPIKYVKGLVSWPKVWYGPPLSTAVVMQISDVISTESWCRRDITLADTNCETNVNFWADFAENVQVEVDQHVAIRNLRIGTY